MRELTVSRLLHNGTRDNITLLLRHILKLAMSSAGTKAINVSREICQGNLSIT